MKLSPEEIEEVRTEMSRLPDRKAACIDALRIVQAHHGWVSDELVVELAELMGMDPAEIDSVATFYNLIFRRPRGRNVIFCCDSVSCWIMGAEKLHDELRQLLDVRFGETTIDDRFTLLPIACLGACDRAPAMMINEDLHGGVVTSRLPILLEDYE